MTQDPQDQDRVDNESHSSDSSVWNDVTRALNELGSSIARATSDVIADEENKRRMRELSQGLATLASRLGDAAQEALDVPVAKHVDRVAAAAAEPMREATAHVTRLAADAGPQLADAATKVAAAGEQVVAEVRPAVLDALRLANAKFKAVAEEFGETAASEQTDRSGAAAEVARPASSAEGATGPFAPVSSAGLVTEHDGYPVAPGSQAPAAAPGAQAPASAAAPTQQPEHPASVTGRFAAIISERASSIIGGVTGAVSGRGGESEPGTEEPSIHDWLFPEGAAETELQLDLELEPAAPVVPATSQEAAPAAPSAVSPLPAAPVAPVLAAPSPEPATPIVPVPAAPVVPASVASAVPPVAPAPTTPPASAAQAPVGAAVPRPAPTSDQLSAVRIAHERFLAERELAEGAARAARARSRSERRKGGTSRRQRPHADDDDTSLWERVAAPPWRLKRAPIRKRARCALPR